MARTDASSANWQPPTGKGAPLPSEALSLSSLFTADFAAAVSHLQQASRAEPLNLQHEVRKALLLARFGDFASASTKLEQIKKLLPDLPLIDYLRALFALRGGRPEQARAITGSLETAHPQFIPGKFLRAEAQIGLASKAAAAEKYIISLPAAKQWEALWADLLVKLVLLHPNDGPALAQKHLEKKLPRDSTGFELVRRAIAWAGASTEQLGELLAKEPPGSRSEALVLERLVELLGREPSEKAVRFLRNLRRLHPHRAGLRGVCNSFLIRRASELSGGGRHEEAVRLAEQCLREEPQDLIFHQNRAALFTLLREQGAYHEAWAALNRHQYRLALLGACDSFTVRQIAITHRLFGQQARGGVPGERGIFRFVEGKEGEEGREEPRLVTCSEEIASDPDLLRQWIHHTAAELVFRHGLLGANGPRPLLLPETRDEAMKRAAGLDALANSLGILVPTDGPSLAEVLSSRWQRCAASTRTRYGSLNPSGSNGSGESSDGELNELKSAQDADPEVERLKREHIEAIADVCLVCLQWRPKSDQLWVAEELLQFACAETPFLDETTLYGMESIGEDAHRNIQVLSWYLRSVTGAGRGAKLTPAQRQATMDAMMGELLREMANSAYAGHSGSAKESAAVAMPFVDRARTLRCNDPSIELTAAELLTSGEYFQEANVALERFRRFVQADSEKLIERGQKLAEVLRERSKEGKAGEKRQKRQDPTVARENREERIRQIEQEVDRSPSSWRVYEDLVHELGLSGRFEEAIQWANRAVAHCLSRVEQMNARGLAIETLGLKELAETDVHAARLYATGAHQPARNAIETLAEGKAPGYALLYLLGRCQLATGEPAMARESFRKAAQVCERQLHHTVLRGLTDNIDSAYLAVARSALNDTLQEGSSADALTEATAVFARLQEPAAWVVDFARVFYSSAVARVITSRPPLTVPRIKVAGPLEEALNNALREEDDVDRALALTEVAALFHPASARPAQVLADRVRKLKGQIAAAEALKEAGQLLGARQFDSARQLIEKLDSAIATEPRLLRIRALAFLGLGRFNDADLAVEQIGQGGGTDVREFVVNYPSLALRQRIAVAQQLLRDLKPQEAEAALRGAVTTSRQEEAGLAYCRGFAATLQGYELRRNGQLCEAQERFVSALGLIEPFVHDAGPNERQHLTDLYDRLEKEVEKYA